MKKIKLKLKNFEIKKLNSIVKKGTAKAREITRARTLLLLDQNEKNSTIARVLNINPSTVYNIKSYYFAGGIETAIYDAPRPGAPGKFSPKQKAAITALACTEAPKGYAKWSLNLLSQKAVEIEGIDSISSSHIDRILKKTR